MTIWNEDNGGVNIDLLRTTDTVKRLATSRRFPSQVLKSTLDITEKHGLIPCIATVEGKKTSIGIADQIKGILETLTNPFKNGYLFVIGVNDVESRALTLAGAIFMEAVRHSYESRNSVVLPLWHWVQGGHWDRIRDNRNSENITNFSMLCLANIAENSTPEKLEKVRDLLWLHNHLPRIVVVAGGDPLTFCVNKLYMRPHRIAYLGSRKAPPVRKKI